MFLTFVGRQEELNFLQERFKSNQFELIIIYGRRRIGKTTLIKKFLEGKSGFYFLCDRAGTERNASRLKQKIARFLNEPTIESNDLYDIFDNLMHKFKDPAVIVLDEFSYLVEKDNAIPSILQHIIDEELINSKFMLILCGSSMSMMEKGVMSSKSPLYGRKTGHIKLQELNFVEIKEFYPKNSITKNIEYYSILGGVPHYLEKFSDSKSTIQNINNEIFSKTGRLYEELEFLLKEEFREPDIYKTILTAIGEGNTRVVEIANKASIPAHDLPKYLGPLLALGIIKKEFSITDIKKKKPRYYIMDNFVNFWFNFCEPFKSELELMDLDIPMEYLKKNLNSYIGKRFEEMVREQLLKKVIPFRAQKIGKFWLGDTEIDAVAMDKKNSNMAVVEIKFKENVDPTKIKRALESKVKSLAIKFKNISYITIAKSFTKKAEGCYSPTELLAK